MTWFFISRVHWASYTVCFVHLQKFVSKSLNSSRTVTSTEIWQWNDTILESEKPGKFGEYFTIEINYRHKKPFLLATQLLIVAEDPRSVQHISVRPHCFSTGSLLLYINSTIKHLPALWCTCSTSKTEILPKYSPPSVDK